MATSRLRLLTLASVLGCGETVSADLPNGGAASEARGGFASMDPAMGGASAMGGAAPTSGSAGAAPMSGSAGSAPTSGSAGAAPTSGSAGAAPTSGSAGTGEGGDVNGGAAGGARDVAAGGLAQGGAGAPTGPTLEPVRVIRGDPLNEGWVDLTVRGVGLDDYDGKVVTVRIGMPDRAPERLGSGQARIEAGAFELFFPEVWESSLYKQKLVYIDVDGDGSCDPVMDRLYADFRAVLTPELAVRGSGAREPAEFFPSDMLIYCEPFNAPWPAE